MINLNTLKLTTIKTLVSVPNNSEAREYRASLISGAWYGKRVRGLNKFYPINVPKNICDTIHYIFSSRTNDYWPEGTIKKHDKLNKPNYVDNGFWTPFRHHLVFKGTLINGVIQVDWKDHQKRIIKEYGNTRYKLST